MATFKDKSDDQELQVDETFVVCGAGGGTVDPISYEVIGLKPLRLKECAIGEDGLCGSVFVNMNFESWVKIQVGDGEYARIRLVNKEKKMINMFESILALSGVASREYSVDLRGIKDNLGKNILDDIIPVKVLVLSVPELLQDFTDTSLQRRPKYRFRHRLRSNRYARQLSNQPGHGPGTQR